MQKNLIILKEKSSNRSLAIEEIIPFFSGKGKILLLIFLCIPFSQILGLAIPFGFIIAYLGLRYAFFKNSWAPGFVLKKKIPSRILHFILRQILSFISMIGKFSYRRMSWISQETTMQKISGCLISLVGVFLAISLPIPLSSYLASAAILFIGIGILNDDGLLMGLGYFLAIFYLGFVAITLKYISITDLLGSLDF